MFYKKLLLATIIAGTAAFSSQSTQDENRFDTLFDVEKMCLQDSKFDQAYRKLSTADQEQFKNLVSECGSILNEALDKVTEICEKPENKSLIDRIKEVEGVKNFKLSMQFGVE